MKLYRRCDSGHNHRAHYHSPCIHNLLGSDELMGGTRITWPFVHISGSSFPHRRWHRTTVQSRSLGLPHGIQVGIIGIVVECRVFVLIERVISSSILVQPTNLNPIRWKVLRGSLNSSPSDKLVSGSIEPVPPLA